MEDANAHANMVLTLLGLGALALGTFAMLVRWVIQWRRRNADLVGNFIADVKRGEGFTFHRQLNGKAQDGAPPLLSWRDWTRLVNERPDEVPHVGIEGATGTTKTTLAEAIVATRGGQVVIITAKPDEHQWGGLPFITIDDDGGFSEAEAWLSAILGEASRRLVCAKRREDVGNFLTVVLDDFTRLRSKCPSAAEVIELIGDQGRSIRIRLILITRSKLVEALGIKGQGDWRDNLVFISLDRQRRAFLEWDGTTYQIDTKPAYQLSKQRVPFARAWEMPAPAQNKAEEFLSRLFEEKESVPVCAGAGEARGDPERTSTTGTNGTPHQNAVPSTDHVPAIEEGVPATLTPEAIRTLYSVWGSKNKIAALLTGTKAKRLAIIDEALAKTEQPEHVS